MNEFFESIVQAWNELFDTPLGQMTALQLILLAAVCFVLFVVIKWLLKYLWKGIKVIFSGLVYIFSPKERCKKYQCTTCGRTLDKCTCIKNKNKSYVSRLFAYKKEQRQRKKNNSGK